MKPKLPDDVLRALEQAKRTAGWNNRRNTVQRFDLDSGFGHGCTLYVVPYRRFAYRRQERMLADYSSMQGNPQGSAA